MAINFLVSLLKKNWNNVKCGAPRRAPRRPGVGSPSPMKVVELGVGFWSDKRR